MRPREIVGIGLLMAFCIIADLFMVFSPINMAYADEPTPNTYEMAFLERMAQETNQTPNDLVVNIAVTTAVTTGKQVAKSGTNGISKSNTLSQNLSNLRPPNGTVQFKNWNTLEETIQNQWGSKDNYHAAMFNMLMGSGYGTKTMHDGFVGSGGDNWENPNTTLTNRLSEVFANYNDNSGNTVQQLMDIVKGGANWYEDYMGRSNEFDATNSSNWPSGISRNVNYVYASEISWKWWVHEVNANNPNVWTSKTSIPCYWVYLYNGSNLAYLMCFNNQNFTYSQGDNGKLNNYNALSSNGVYIQYYNPNVTQDELYRIGFPPMTPTAFTSISESALFTMASIMLNGDISENTGVPSIEDYPADIQQDLNVTVKVPTGGVTPSTTWNQFIVSSGGESGGESETDLSDVIQLLQSIWGKVSSMAFDNGDLKVYDNRVFLTLDAIYTLLDEWFDKWSAPDVDAIVGNLDFPEFKSKIEDLEPDLRGLMPFGAIFFYQQLFDFIALVGPVDEPVFTFDFNFIRDNPQTIEIDLGFLDDALVLFRFFSIALLCISLVKLTMKFVVSEVV